VSRGIVVGERRVDGESVLLGGAIDVIVSGLVKVLFHGVADCGVNDTGFARCGCDAGRCCFCGVDGRRGTLWKNSQKSALVNAAANIDYQGGQSFDPTGNSGDSSTTWEECIVSVHFGIEYVRWFFA
jgi:hypothetical protein